MIFNVRHHKDLPVTIRSRICSCGTINLYGDYPVLGQNHRCSICFKPRIYLAYQCTGCDTHFVRHGDTSFKHPRFCSFNPKCWGCLQKIDKHSSPKDCCTVCNKYTDRWLSLTKDQEILPPKRIEGVIDEDFDIFA